MGITQEALAEKADLHRTYISDIERGTRNLSLENIHKLALALEISVPGLFYLSVDPDGKRSERLSCQVAEQFVDILLVEDNPDDVELTLHAFKKACFANRVHVVRDGAEALNYLYCRGKYSLRRPLNRPQMILLDLNLPKVSGLEVLRHIKGDKEMCRIPVVVLTTSKKDRDVVECRRLGVESYILKPVNFQGLSLVTPALNLQWGLFKPLESKQHDMMMKA